MTTDAFLARFCQNHLDFAAYVEALAEPAFEQRFRDKWTAGQHLHHLELCLLPIAQALAAKAFIRTKFGIIYRPGMPEATVVESYQRALAEGGTAPERFVPEPVDAAAKPARLEALREVVVLIQHHLAGYTDDELDTLVLPHPLLGKLTIREMMFLMTYHATHHQRQLEAQLATGGSFRVEVPA